MSSRHRQAALETMIADEGLSSGDMQQHYRDARDHACDRTPHREPIELRPDDFRDRMSERHALGRHIAGEQGKPEAEHQSRRQHLDPAHQQIGFARARRREAPRQSLGADRERGNRRNCDGGAQPHDEGRSDAGPEQPLRQ